MNGYFVWLLEDVEEQDFHEDDDFSEGESNIPVEENSLGGSFFPF